MKKKALSLPEQRDRAYTIRRIGKDIRAKLPAASGARSLLREVEQAVKLAQGLPDDGDKAIKRLIALLADTRLALAEAQTLLDETRKYLNTAITRYPIP